MINTISSSNLLEQYWQTLHLQWLYSVAAQKFERFLCISFLSLSLAHYLSLSLHKSIECVNCNMGSFLSNLHHICASIWMCFVTCNNHQLQIKNKEGEQSKHRSFFHPFSLCYNYQFGSFSFSASLSFPPPIFPPSVAEFNIIT